MSIEVKVPQLPESVADATLVAWHKKPGQTVAREENLVDLETDKVVLEVPAPTNGTLVEIKAEEGAVVTSGDLLALLEAGEAPAAKEREAEPEAAPAAAPVESKAPEAKSAAHKLSPSVRRLVEEHDIDPSAVAGSGKDGRITKSDVMAFLKTREPVAEKGAKVPVARPAPQPMAAGPRTEERVPMTRLRARIAERLVEAQHTAALLTTFNEVDLTEVKSLRARYRESFEKAHGVRLGFMSFFVKASVEALRKFPVVNASVEGDDIIYRNYQDIGIAVSTERGLLVPILRNAETMSFADIEIAINDFAAKARDGNIGMEDLTGGTFTITNGGIFGSLISTPIVNPPQTAILGMHAIQDRPVAVDGAMTYDHRIIDGKGAVQFLVSIKQSLEDPARLMLQV
jgi:2-oxoglutarate dehydrogenase E2 component (dihydrolipoamide succinyltransferase)